MVEYHKYDLEDFLSDEQFVKWVLHPDKNNDLFWKNWLEEHQEKLKVAEEAIFIIRHIRFKNDSLPQNDKLLKNILKHQYSNKVILHRRDFNWMRIAAVVSLLFAASITFMLFPTERIMVIPEIVQVLKENPNGQKSTFVLPDGTMVRLNSGSRLTFPQKFSGHDRVVELSGEAFFNVAHNPEKPFIVHADDLNITALGTSFNVSAYDDESNIEVALVTGKILVRNVENGGASATSSMLHPGEKIKYDKISHLFEVTDFNHDREIGWKDGKLIFQSDDFNTFVKSIEKWYGVEVIANGAPHREWRINGMFENLSLELLMESLKFSKEIEYSIMNKKVIINFK